MSRKGLWIAALVVLVSNAYALGRASLDRRGEPEAVLELTERELRLAPRETENTAMTLRLMWTDPSEGEREAGWFDRARLASVGFDCRPPVTEANAADYRTTPPRSAFVVLEYDGDAWRRYIDLLPDATQRDTAARQSRLVPIDVGLDADALRARHPDRRRTVIVPVTAGLSFVQGRGHAPFLRGRINSVLPAEINVPLPLRSALETLPAPAPAALDRRSGPLADSLPGEPRYRATVKWGRSHEPWLDSVRAAATR